MTTKIVQPSTASSQGDGEPAIVVQGLTKSFGEQTVVSDVTMSIKSGEVFGFLGANGSGKTTTIRMLCGLMRPDSGSGKCLGYDIVDQASDIKKNIGYMPQHFSYYRDLTVRENLEFMALLRGAEAQHNVVPYMKEFGLWARKDQLSGQLSGGWKQRLSLCASLLHNPRLLFLDEPTAGVDPESRRYFWDVIHELASQKVTVLVTTHYMDEAERCNRLAFITHGKLQAVGTQHEITQDSGLYAFSVKVKKDYYVLAKRIEDRFPSVLVVVFGSDFHIISGQRELDQTIKKIIIDYDQDVSIDAISTTVEHIFIHLVKKQHAQSIE